MLEFLILLPLIIVSILSMTFQISIDELSNVSRGNYFYYDRYKGDHYRDLQNKVHEFYTRMLDESENELEVSKKPSITSRKSKPFQGKKCKIQEIQQMHRQCMCHKPKKRCIRTEPPSTNVVSVMPECVVVERCEGVCPHSSECLPTSVETITVPVIYLNLVVEASVPDVGAECSTIQVVKHLKCGCACSRRGEDCNKNQMFNPTTCRCECQSPEKAEGCQKMGKFWDSSNCDCICPPNIPQICSTGAFFHKRLCRCVPAESPFEARRRRPPV